MTLLDNYRKKRNFTNTKEPEGKILKKSNNKSKIFVVQKHQASHLHYDFRLEIDGVLKSWAVPKGPSLVAGVKRLAVMTEDHPLEYANFEGVIPQGEYGAGTVEIWDHGTWEESCDFQAWLKKRKLEFKLYGKKMRGNWVLIGLKNDQNNWLLIKVK